MNEENKSNYYAIIPSVVRYDDELTDKAKLLYGEITCLSNKEGYCFATNNYFANLYHCTSRAIQIAISKLQERGYIRIVIENNFQRKIFLSDSLGYEKNFVGGHEKIFTNNNIKSNIEDLFNFIINNNKKIPTKFYDILDRLDFLYTQEILDIMQKDKVQMLKEIIYILYDLYNSKFSNLLSQINRETLINLYILAQEHSPNSLLNYYKKSIINKYTNNNT